MLYFFCYQYLYIEIIVLEDNLAALYIYIAIQNYF